jgi:hypothetical protein
MSSLHSNSSPGINTANDNNSDNSAVWDGHDARMELSAENETSPSPEDLPPLLSPAIPVQPSSSSSHPEQFRPAVTVIRWSPFRQPRIAAASSGPGVEGISLTDRELVINVDEVDFFNHLTGRRGAGVRPTPHDLGTLALSGSDPPFSEIWRSPEIMHSFLISLE